MKKRYYLAPYPASMFYATGMMRMATKSTLNNELRVNVSGRSFGKPTTVIYDVSALLWPISWPLNAGNLSDCIVKFKLIVKHGLTQGNVVLVFDTYYTNSTKSYMRMYGGVRLHILTAEVPLPPKTPILGVTNNKVQLNKMLAGAMMDPGFMGMPLRDRCTASLLLVPKMSLLK